MIVIDRVNVLQQRDDSIYSFNLPADRLIELCRVERFGVDPNGVNRKFDENHALTIAEAMIDTSLLWPEAILGDLTGGRWVFDPEAATLTNADGNGYVSIDDGQHRYKALELLNPVERAKLAFSVQVTIGLSFERRLKIFRSQSLRKAIDARLDLAQRHRLGDWKKPVHREAYELVLKLNSDTTSPLRGLVLLEELEKRVYEGRHRPVGINGKGLHGTLCSVMGGASPLAALTPEERARVILDMIRLTATIWPKEWKSDSHILTTARGINAVLSLLVSSPNFRGALGDDFSQESLARALKYAETFKWKASDFRNVSVREIVGRLDQAIGRNKRQVRAAA